MSFFTDTELAEVAALQASAYEHVCTHQTSSEVETDPGDYSGVWADAEAGIPCDVLPGQMTPERRAGQVDADQAVLVKMDYRAGVSVGDRLLVTGGVGAVGYVLEIVGVQNVLGRDLWLHLDCDRDPDGGV